MRTSSKKGFTLIELLVVISIIAILAGLLLPAIGSVRKNANFVKTGKNMNQIFMGLFAYNEDFGSLPLAEGSAETWPTGYSIPVAANTAAVVEEMMLHLAVTANLPAKLFDCPLTSGRPKFDYPSSGDVSKPNGWTNNKENEYYADPQIPSSALGDARRLILGMDPTDQDEVAITYASEGRSDRIKKAAGETPEWKHPEFGDNDDVYGEDSAAGSTTLSWLVGPNT